MILAITGATGAQGYAVLQHVLAIPELLSKLSKIRCLCRHPDSEKALHLHSLSPEKIELVSCDLTNPRDLERAVKDVWAVFFNLNSYDPSIGPKEAELGKMAVDIAIKCHVELFLFSSLPDVQRISHGERTVPHFSNKAATENYLKSQQAMSFIIFQPASYFSNFQNYYIPQRTPKETNTYNIQLCLYEHTRLPGLDIDDMGGVVANALNHYEKYLGQVIPIAGETLALDEYMNILSRATGKTVKLKSISYEECIGLMGPELTEMNHYINDYGYYPPGTDLGISRKIYPKLKSFEEYLRSVEYRIP